MDYVKAFVIGGLICAMVQILMEKTKMLPGRIMVLLVCTGAFLGAIGIYEPFVEFAGAGASVPLLGFGNVLWKGVKEAVEEQGFLGTFAGGLKAGAVGISGGTHLWLSGSPDLPTQAKTIKRIGLGIKTENPSHTINALQGTR